MLKLLINFVIYCTLILASEALFISECIAKFSILAGSQFVDPLANHFFNYRNQTKFKNFYLVPLQVGVRAL